ncbi:MAG TPA: alpha/beta-hydrolase family protein [Euzebyales bacterium]
MASTKITEPVRTAPRAASSGPGPEVMSRYLSRAGLLGAGVFFAFSLFPSLLPRAAPVQGIVSGITVMIGYGLGVGVHWLWDYLGLPRTRGQARQITDVTVIVVVGFVMVSATWQHVGWQNAVRSLFGMDPVGPTGWPTVLVVTILVAAMILVVARSMRVLFHIIVGRLGRRLPRRLSLMLGAALLTVLLLTLWSGVLVNGFFTAANWFFAPRDAATDDGIVQPTSANRSGSPASLVPWDSLGRKGRTFVATGPTIEDLDDFNGGGAIEPIRVYAGLESADTLRARADLVLEELKRTNAFERDVLVVATTTGTGFLDANGVDPVEYIHNGDTAIVGVQYSYLPSWISLLADQEVVREDSRVVFDTIHGYWSTLPEASRPDIYLYGLSLGAYGAEAVLTSIGIVNEPIDGALLTGPPFVNELRNRLVAERDPGSPPWLPVYRRGRTVRFMAEDAGIAGSGTPWGDTRILYLQHASDPVVFFSPHLAYSPPEWLMDGQRGPDVADDFVWVPIVTMWQVLLDLPAAGGVPDGFGHMYSPEANAEGWAAVTDADWWSDIDTEALADALQDGA